MAQTKIKIALDALKRIAEEGGLSDELESPAAVRALAAKAIQEIASAPESARFTPEQGPDDNILRDGVKWLNGL